MSQALSYVPADHVTRYSTKGSPTLKRFMLSEKPVQGLMGPFGSGKSVACVVKTVMLGHAIPPGPDGVRRTRWGIIRNTYGQLQDTTMRTMFEWLPESRWGKYLKSEHRYVVDAFTHPDGGPVEIEYLFRALDRPDHVQNLLSLELTHAWINEAREIPREILGPLRGRLGRFPRRDVVGNFQRFLLMDTNPPDTDSWWYELFEERRPEAAELFRQPGGRSGHAENLIHLPEGYYTDMVDTMSADEVKVYVDAEYGYLATGKPVYPEYNDSFHCREFDVKPGPIYIGWDFGLTPAAVFVQMMPNGQVRIFDELCAERAGIQNFAPEVIKLLKHRYPWTLRDGELNPLVVKHIGDPAGQAGKDTDERSCFDILRAAGVECWPGVQEPTLRQESVRYMLRFAVDGQPGMLLHPRAKMLRKGFQGEYHHRRMLVGGQSPRYAEKPDKNKYSHPHDAFQYVAVDLVGDRVQGLESKLHPRSGRQQQLAISDFNPLDVRDGAAPVDDFDDLMGDSQWQQYAYSD